MLDWANSTIADVVAGNQAFTGSTTVNLSAGDYAQLLASNSTGNLYFPAVVVSDITAPGDGVLIGEYQVITAAVSEPTTTALSCLGMGALLLRRKRS